MSVNRTPVPGRLALVMTLVMIAIAPTPATAHIDSQQGRSSAQLAAGPGRASSGNGASNMIRVVRVDEPRAFDWTDAAIGAAAALALTMITAGIVLAWGDHQRRLGDRSGRPLTTSAASRRHRRSGADNH
jgi:hypothetical protein